MYTWMFFPVMFESIRWICELLWVLLYDPALEKSDAICITNFKGCFPPPPHVRSFPTITNHDVLADCSIPDNIRILCFDTVATHTGTKGGVCGRDFLHLACRPHILEIVHVLVNAFLSLHSRSINESNNVHSGPSSIRRPIGQHQSKIERSEGRGSSSER